MTDLPLRQIPFTDAEGAEKSLDDFGADVLLVVNVASKCGLTPQYEQLEQLQRTYGERGFSVVGFPCNQFGHQEPGDEAEIKAFCATRHDVTFPLFAKIDVNGEHAHPLYQWLKSEGKGILGTEAIKWNFTKFLTDTQGRVIKRYAPTDTPERIGKDIAAPSVA